MMRRKIQIFVFMFRIRVVNFLDLDSNDFNPYRWFSRQNPMPT